MRPPHLLLSLLLLAAPAGEAAAQRTRDESRLLFTLGVGYATGPDLWQVPNQPVLQDGGVDIFSLSRNMRDAWMVTLGGTYFQRPGLGLGVDVTLVNQGYRDGCALAFTSGADRTRQLCASIDGATRSAMSATAAASAILRAAPRADISPFLRVSGGFMWQPIRTTELSGFWTDLPENPPIEVPIYPRVGGSRFSPLGAVGVGFTLPVARAYHLRFEGRATTYNLQAITGPTTRDALLPPRENKWVVQYSFSAGIDLVLERRRGRRY